VRKQKISLGFLVAIFCIMAIPVAIISIAIFPSPEKQVRETMVQKSAPQPYAEFRVAYGNEGPAQPHIVQIAPLPQGGHEILRDFGKIDP